MKSFSVNQRAGSRGGIASRPRGLGWAFRWLLVMVLVFDQLSAPFHHHQHDSGIDAVAVELAEAAASHELTAEAVASRVHADDHDDDHGDTRVGHSATALRTQVASDLSGVHSLGDVLAPI